MLPVATAPLQRLRLPGQQHVAHICLTLLARMDSKQTVCIGPHLGAIRWQSSSTHARAPGVCMTGSKGMIAVKKSPWRGPRQN